MSSRLDGVAVPLRNPHLGPKVIDKLFIVRKNIFKDDSGVTLELLGFIEERKDQVMVFHN